MTKWLFGEILPGSLSEESLRLKAPASQAGSVTKMGSTTWRGHIFPRQQQAGQCDKQGLSRAPRSSPNVIPLGFCKNKGQSYLGDSGRNSNSG